LDTKKWIKAVPIMNEVRNEVQVVRALMSKSYVLEESSKNALKIANIKDLRKYSNAELAIEGESILNTYITMYLLKATDRSEGELVELQKLLNSKQALEYAVKTLNFENLVQISSKDALLIADAAKIDALYALIAVVKDSIGLYKAFSFIETVILPQLLAYAKTQAKVRPVNFMVSLDKLAKYVEKSVPKYKLLSKKPVFSMGVYIHNKLQGVGYGATEIDAQRDAAAAGYFELARKSQWSERMFEEQDSGPTIPQQQKQ